MNENVSEELVESVPGEEPEEAGGSEEVLPPGGAGEAGLPNGPQVTFRGNTYDLISLGSLVTGALILFSCLTCNTGYYCLPLISVALGAVGLLSARQAVEVERTKLWSWLGIVAGGIVLLLVVLCFVLYIGFIALAIVTDEWG